jgi:hypothetical protein
MKHNNIPQLLMSTRGHTKNILKFIMKILELHTVKPTLVTTSIKQKLIICDLHLNFIHSRFHNN